MSTRDPGRAPDEVLQEVASAIAGRLDGDRRRDFVDRLDVDPDLYEATAEAAAILADVEDDAGTSDRGLRRRGAWGVGLLAAATVAGLAVGTTVSRAPDSIAEMRALISVDGAGLAPGWAEPAWPSDRGEGSRVSPGSRAFRAGVRLSQLALATYLTEDALADGILEAMVELYDDPTAPSGVGAELRRARASRSSSEGSVDVEFMRSVLETDPAAPWMHAGAALEAARLSVLGGDDLEGANKLVQSGLDAVRALDLRPEVGESIAATLDELSAGTPTTATRSAWAGMLTALIAAVAGT